MSLRKEIKKGLKLSQIKRDLDLNEVEEYLRFKDQTLITIVNGVISRMRI